jgi:hypothetical protein
MHTWPQLRNLVRAQVSAAFSTSASSKTSTGAWPPSSIETRLTPSAASASRRLPTGTEPVSEILRTMGERTRCSEMKAGSPVTRLSTPGGRPASWHACTIAMHEPGASSAGLTMIEQPAASAAAIFRVGSRAGKFQGENAATTPTGS